jgi:hypothetical protein
MKITVIGNLYLSLKAEEITTLELAGKVLKLTKSKSQIIFKDLLRKDPMRFKSVI